MDVSDWQERLEKYFTVNGTVGGHLLDILDQEEKYGEYIITTCHGQRVLMDSFFSFFIETIRTANSIIKSKGWPSHYPIYGYTVLYYVTLFRSFRAAENLLTRGYPFDGYALLRDIKDRTIFLAGIAHEITSLVKIFGDSGNNALTDATYKKLKNERKKGEFRVLNEMIREKSGLDSGIRCELKKWEQLFHDEVHGSKLTFFTESRQWFRGEKPLSIGPVPIEKQYGMYMNRSSEIGWLIVRLLPFLQIEPYGFGEEWAEKWNVLDDSYKIMVEGLEKKGKKIATAFIFFINTKFLFTPETCYHENYQKNNN